MRFTGGRLGQALRPGGAVRELPENTQIPLAVGLKHDPLAVGGPDRQAIAPTKHGSLQGTATHHVVDQHCALSSVVQADGNLSAVGRHTREFVPGWWQFERRDRPLTVDECDVQLRGRNARGTGHVHKGARVRHSEPCDAAAAESRSPHPLDDRHRSTFHLEPVGVEWHGVDHAADDIGQVTAPEVPSVAASLHERLPLPGIESLRDHTRGSPLTGCGALCSDGENHGPAAR